MSKDRKEIADIIHSFSSLSHNDADHLAGMIAASESADQDRPDLADTLLAWADQMEAESPTVGRMLAIELRSRINNFKDSGADN
jgi:hypothetical protein